MLRYSELEPRPTYEVNTLLLEISTGCSQPKPCNFCGFYGKAFSLRPLEEISAELDEVATTWRAKPPRAFFLAGNAFGIGGDRLASIMRLVREKVPSVKSFGGFMRVEDIKHLTDEQLAELAELGASDLSIGAESGVDETLSLLGKMHRANDITEQCGRLAKAGITFTLWYMAGSAPAGACVENARVSAQIFSQLNPKRVFVTTLSVFPDTELERMVESGEYELANDHEIVQEIRELFAGLTCKTIFDCSNESNLVKFRGLLPEKREEVLAEFDYLLEGTKISKSKRTKGKPTIAHGKETHRLS